jgi:ADP-heptose:LPS heptosyltransferase
MKIQSIRHADYWLGGALIILLIPLVFILNMFFSKFSSRRDEVFIMKILGGGSLLIAYPELLNLKKNYPNKKLILVCSSSVSEFSEITFLFDKIIIVKLNSPVSLIISALIAVREAFRVKYFINLEAHSKLCTIFTAFTFAEYRFGLAENYHFYDKYFVNKLVFNNSHTPIYTGYENLFSLITNQKKSWQQACKSFQSANNFKIRSIHNAREKKSILLAPFCSGLYKEREFGFDDLMSTLHIHLKSGVESLELLGSRADIDSGENIIRGIKNNFPNLKVINGIGKYTLHQIVDKFQKTDCLISIDSGLLHLARLLEVPILSFWGPSDPLLRLRNINSLIENHQYNKMPCSPCVHMVQTPPCLGDNKCMQAHSCIDPIVKNPVWILN